jgi:hypothetical protein
MARFRIVKEYEVEGKVSLDEATAAVNTYEGSGSYGRDATVDGVGTRINVYRSIPRPMDWDDEAQGKWAESDEYKTAQVYADVRLTNKEITRQL